MKETPVISHKEVHGDLSTWFNQLAADIESDPSIWIGCASDIGLGAAAVAAAEPIARMATTARFLNCWGRRATGWRLGRGSR